MSKVKKVTAFELDGKYAVMRELENGDVSIAKETGYSLADYMQDGRVVDESELPKKLAGAKVGEES